MEAFQTSCEVGILNRFFFYLFIGQTCEDPCTAIH